MKESIVVFDCDGTLIKGNSTLIFLFLLRGPFYLIKDFIQILPYFILYIFGKVEEDIVKEKLINKALQSTSDFKIKEVLSDILPNALKKNLRPEAIKILDWHKKQGHRCLIVSSSPKPIILSLSKFLNMELIASECNDMKLVDSNNRFLLISPNCKGSEKLIRLVNYLGFTPKPIYLEVYGDSRGDKELLNSSNYPHYRSFKNKPKEYIERNIENYLITFLAIFILFIGLNKLFSIDLSQSIILKISIKKLIYWLPLFYLILFFSYLGRYLRWRILLDSFSIGTWNFYDALVWFKGFSLTATPAKIGEIFRVHQVNKYLGYPKDILFLIFFIERFLDLISVLIWLTILSPNLFFNKLNIFSNFYYLGIFIFFSSIGIIFFNTFINQFQRILKIIYKIKKKKVLFFNSIKALIVSLLFWLSEALILWLLVFVLSPNQILIQKALCIYFLSGIAGVLSGLPGGIGINEATSSIMLQQAGVPALYAISISIIRRLITLWSITALSIFTSIFIKN